MYVEKIPRTPPLTAAALALLHGNLARNLKHSGNALHNAVVDVDFLAVPRNRIAPVGSPSPKDDGLQMPPDFAPVVTHAAAIARANSLRYYLLNHLNDGLYAHNVADTANAAIIVAIDATDIPTLSALLVQYRTALNQHFANTASHNRIVLVMAVTTVPVDEPTNIQVVNSILLLLESHLYSAAVATEVDPI